MKEKLPLNEIKRKLEEDKKFLESDFLLEEEDKNLELFKSEDNKLGLSPAQRIILDKLNSIYKNSKGNPITLAKQIDFILSNFMDHMLEDLVNSSDLSIISSDEKNVDDKKEAKIEDAKEFVSTFIKTLVKSLNLYKSNLS